MNTQKRAILAASVALALGSAYVSAQVEHSNPQDRPSAQNDVAQSYERASEDSNAEERRDAMQERQEIDSMAEQAIGQLRSSPEQPVDVGNAAGYAVFDTTKAGLIATGAGGSGVAMDNSSHDKTYMHVGAAGVGFGAGVENYKLILVFEDASDYQDFVDGNWSGGASAQAAAGEEGISTEAQSLEGVEVYRLSDEGLIAQADVTGMRFWPSEELNSGATVARSGAAVSTPEEQDRSDVANAVQRSSDQRVASNSGQSAQGSRTTQQQGDVGSSTYPPFEEVDTNSDGQISRLELAMIEGIDFSIADENQDGSISRDEYQQATRQ